MSDFGNRLADDAEKFVKAKVPYVHRGISFQGVDCTGLLIAVLKRMGYLKKYKLRKYSRDWNLHAGAGDNIRQEMLPYAEPVKSGRVQRGDLILFRFGKCIAHLGIATGRGTFIHAHRDAGRCKFGSLNKGKWASRKVGIYRLVEEKF